MLKTFHFYKINFCFFKYIFAYKINNQCFKNVYPYFLALLTIYQFLGCHRSSTTLSFYKTLFFISHFLIQNKFQIFIETKSNLYKLSIQTYIVQLIYCYIYSKYFFLKDLSFS